MRKYGHHKLRRGMTLTELAIVLGAMGLVIAAIWAIVGVVWNGYRVYTVKQQLFTVTQNIRDYYGKIGGIYQLGTRNPFADGADITAEVDDDARRLIPVEMRLVQKTHRGSINHALATVAGGSFHIESYNSGGVFRTRLYGLKKDNCMVLLMQYPVLMPEMGIIRVKTQASGTTVTLSNVSDPGNGVKLPIDAPTASTWCASQDNNEVAFDFKLRN